MHNVYNAPDKVFAGIGNRDAPLEALELCQRVSETLGNLGYVLRTGGAEGCDNAFLAYARFAEVFVPWDRFNGIPMRHHIPKHAFTLAETYVNDWKHKTNGFKALHARNMMQVLGPHLETPSNFIVCYTRDGCDSKETRTSDTGGTGSAIACASDRGIPIINLAKPGWSELLSVLTGHDFLILEETS